MRWANGANFGPPMNSISWGATSCHVFVSTLVLSAVPPCLESKLLGKAHGPFRPTSSLLAPVSLARAGSGTQSCKEVRLKVIDLTIWKPHLSWWQTEFGLVAWFSYLLLGACPRLSNVLAGRSKVQSLSANVWGMQWCQRNVHVIKILGIKKCIILSILKSGFAASSSAQRPHLWPTNSRVKTTYCCKRFLFSMSPLYRAFITSSWLHDPLVHFQLHNGLETEELGPKRASYFFCRFLGGKINSQTSALRECWERQSLGKWIQESFHSCAFWASSRTWGIFA